MAEVGINLKRQITAKLLHIQASRPTLQGLEMHLLNIHKLLAKHKPRTVIIDPISSLMIVGTNSDVRSMLIRLIDTLKQEQINALFTSLTHHQEVEYFDPTVEAVSSLADTWIHVTNENISRQRVRSLLIVKSRGMGHAGNQQNFVIDSKGIHFRSIELKQG